jgi:MFS transporter, DHA2 family, methylenomycin A resistance protein
MRLFIAVLIVISNMEVNFANLAIYQLSHQFKVSIISLTWINNGFLITYAATLILAGRLNDRYGSRLICTFGLIIYAIAASTTGLASHWQIVIIGRLIQGVGAAFIVNSVAPLLYTTYSLQEKPKAQTWFGIANAAGLALGPIIGGILIQQLGWRNAFIVQAPFALLLLLPTLFLLIDTEHKHEAKIPVSSALLLAFSLLLLSTGITQLGLQQTSHWLAFILLLICIAILIIYYFWDKNKTNPLINFAILHNPLSLMANSSRFFLQGVFFFYYFAIALLAQKVFLLSPLMTALIFIIPGFVLGIAYPIGSSLMQRYHYRLPLSLGLSSSIIACLLLSQHFLTYSVAGIIIGNVFLLFGLGIVNVVLSSVVIQQASKNQAGVANGISMTFAFAGAGLVLIVASIIPKAFGNKVFQHASFALS